MPNAYIDNFLSPKSNYSGIYHVGQLMKVLVRISVVQDIHIFLIRTIHFCYTINVSIIYGTGAATCTVVVVERLQP
jgi:hypothetical protein